MDIQSTISLYTLGLQSKTAQIHMFRTIRGQRIICQDRIISRGKIQGANEITAVVELRDPVAGWRRQTIYILQGKKRNQKKLHLPKLYQVYLHSSAIQFQQSEHTCFGKISSFQFMETDHSRADGSLSIHSHRAAEQLVHHVFLGQT